MNGSGHMRMPSVTDCLSCLQVKPVTAAVGSIQSLPPISGPTGDRRQSIALVPEDSQNRTVKRDFIGELRAGRCGYVSLLDSNLWEWARTTCLRCRLGKHLRNPRTRGRPCDRTRMRRSADTDPDCRILSRREGQALVLSAHSPQNAWRYADEKKRGCGSGLPHPEQSRDWIRPYFAILPWLL
ncbi:hypothetical protein PRIPAC_77638 [Pristionchus pacificus]|uniref:Uncharacterized protein n=1 Tax=Pristionchus pacificus TaxID=54126 RepID=A0A2A6BI04_PRIPA|nr:hypothetical protein PRIPAC_77638 [Pristionchus pacificus]|eukprot:PDM65519.1 hypothetical protein PRIPAC_52461 [Pristionchus pacificus]